MKFNLSSLQDFIHNKFKSKLLEMLKHINQIKIVLF